MFLGDILFNMKVVIDEITMFLANLGAFTPYLAFKAFLNTIRYDEYKIGRAAIEYKIPVITTLSGANAALRAIRFQNKKLSYNNLQEIFNE